MQRRLRFYGGAEVSFQSAAAADIGIVDSFDVGEREAGLITVHSASDVRRAGSREERKIVTTEIAKTMSLEEELAAALLDDFRLHGRRCGCARVRVAGVARRIVVRATPKLVDDQKG